MNRSTVGARWVRSLVSLGLMIELFGCGGGGGATNTIPSFSVGGTVSGLLSGTSVAIENNGRDLTTISSSGAFVFSTPITSGGNYSVTISAQPAGQTCVVGAGSGAVGAANITSVTVACAPTTYQIGGTITGLAAGATVTLDDNGSDALVVSSNSSFVFPTAVATGGTYKVTVGAPPSGGSCTVSAGTGVVGMSNVSSVAVTCVPAYTVGGSISGLASGSTIVLSNAGSDTLTISTNSTFAFKTALPAGSAYDVSVGADPLNQLCYVSNGAGVIGSSNVTSVIVSCPVFNTIWNFGYGADGSYPQAGLVLGSDGAFYGTTAYGGPNLHGTVYRVTPQGDETIFSNLNGTNSYRGTTAPVFQGVGGVFYGTTGYAGSYSLGSVFAISSSGTESTLWSFGNGSDGASPSAGVIQGSDGNLYGTTTIGGAYNFGAVYRLTPGGVETILWSFGAGQDGQYPTYALLEGSDGNLYGTTSSGGAYSRGTVFKLTLSGVETVLWSFNYTDGSGPASALIQATDGNYYGTTIAGGSYGGGTFYRVTSSGVHAVLWNFGSGSDGGGPEGDIVQARDGNFYGTTDFGGLTATSGTIYRIAPDGTETVLWNQGFGLSGASVRVFGLTQGPNGYFYGVTASGGSANNGSVFELMP